jgi:hypothetical protein
MDMRIKHIRGRQSGRDPNIAKMSAVGQGKFITYSASDSAKEILAGWEGGAELEWEVDDVRIKPTYIHLTPATSGGFKFKPEDRSIALPTRYVGLATVCPAQVVDELVTQDLITVKLPAFWD